MSGLLLLHLPDLDIRLWRDRGKDLLPRLAALGLSETSLAVSHPLSGIAAATSLVTGALPEAHGVWSEEEGWPLGIRRTSQSSWRVPPLWQTLAGSGRATGSVNWPASTPGTGWPGFHVDERSFVATGRSWDEWVLPPACCPPLLREKVREQRVHPAELTGATLLPFLPSLLELDQERTHVAEAVARAVAVAASVQAVATGLLAEPLDFLAVNLPILASTADIAAEYQGVEQEAAFRFVDAALAHLVERSGGRWHVLLVGHGRRGASGVALADAALALPPVLPLTDVAPLLLRHFRADAKVGNSADPPRPIPPKRHGYDPAAGPPLAWEVAHRVRIARLTLSRAPAATAELLDAVLAVVPDDPDALRLRALIHAGLSEPTELEEIGRKLCALAPDKGWGRVTLAVASALRGDAAAARTMLAGASADDDYDSLYRLGAAWLLVGEPERARPIMARAVDLQPARPEAVLGLAQIELSQRQLRRAEERLRAFVTADPGHLEIARTLAEALVALGRSREAQQWLDAADRLTRASATP